MEPRNLLQEMLLNVLLDSYKKAQEKMKQQTLEALLLIDIQAPAQKREECTQTLKQMHSENFSDHEIRILNPKPSFAGDVKKRNEVQWK